jgi:hypothetical protein
VKAKEKGHLNYKLTRLCMTWGSILGSIVIAFWIARTISLGSGSAKTIMSSGTTYSKEMNLYQSPNDSIPKYWNWQKNWSAWENFSNKKYIKGIYISNKDRKNICGTLVPTSGTPPTRVLTVNNPQLAASNMAMQKASVKEL